MTETIILRQIGLPVFQNKVYANREAARLAALGDVELVQCPASGLVHNRAFNPSLLDYDSDYQNEQACSAAFQQHLRDVLTIVLRNFAPDELGVEIGCGKGYFLELLCAARANVIGFDPAYEGSNPQVRREYFGDQSIVITPDFIVLRHVLEHIPTPWQFLAMLSARCEAGTKIYIEVPCFDWILNHMAFYDIFYEHVNYFTLDVLTRAFSPPIDSGRFFGGQYLFLVADLSTFRIPTQYAGRRYDEIAMDSYVKLLMSKRSGGTKKTYLWGAGAKGVTLANIFSRKAVSLEALIDINPAKQGKFSAGAGLPILDPAGVIPCLKGADVFVMNPIYLGEIQAAVADVNVNLIAVA